MALVTRNGLFIHVPKTGGTWVRAAVAAAGLAVRESGPWLIEKHLGTTDMRATHPIMLERFVFGFVRYPASWIRSRFAWAVASCFPAKVAGGFEPARKHWMARCWADDLAGFVKNALELEPRIASRSMMPLLGWVPDGEGWASGPDAADFVGRQESLPDDLIIALNLAGETFEPERIRATPRRKVTRNAGDWPELSADLTAQIVEQEKWLCEAFYHATSFMPRAEPASLMRAVS